jgi:ribosomal protein S12 methylthiotransferase accessory factor YcaO
MRSAAGFHEVMTLLRSLLTIVVGRLTTLAMARGDVVELRGQPPSLLRIEKNWSTGSKTDQLSSTHQATDGALHQRAARG